MTARFLWRLLPLALFTPDALAWGLQTHLFFAQYALALVPLADPQLRAAAARLPRLVLAGACLPDLAVIGRFFLGTPVFRRAHESHTSSDFDAMLGRAQELLVQMAARVERRARARDRRPRRPDHRAPHLFVAKSLERAGDHATNVLEHVVYATRGDHLRHAPPFSV